PSATPATNSGGSQTIAPSREPGSAVTRHLRGSPLDRFRDPGTPRQSHCELADCSPPAPRQLPPGVPARLEPEELLSPAADRPLAVREARRPARRSAGPRPRPGTAQARTD